MRSTLDHNCVVEKITQSGIKGFVVFDMILKLVDKNADSLGHP
jgi:hypothetical protein